MLGSNSAVFIHSISRLCSTWQTQGTDAKMEKRDFWSLNRLFGQLCWQQRYVWLDSATGPAQSLTTHAFLFSFWEGVIYLTTEGQAAVMKIVCVKYIQMFFLKN